MFLEALIEYRLCLCVRRGDFVREGLWPCCKIHRGDYVQVVKFVGGIMSILKNSWGRDYVHIYKFEQGGWGGSMGNCPTLNHCALKHFNAPHRESLGT